MTLRTECSLGLLLAWLAVVVAGVAAAESATRCNPVYAGHS